MSIKIHPVLMAAIFIGISVLIFALIRGCNKSSSDQEIITNLQNDLGQLAQKKEEDSLAAEKSKAEFADSLEVANGYLALKENQIQATESKLDSANDRINFLLRRHKEVKPSDSTTTVVPTEYVYECRDCFFELKSQRDLIQQYRKEIDEKNAFTDKITVSYNKRIDQLAYEKQQSNELVNDYKEVAQMAMKKADPRRIVYLSLAAITINSVLPNGVGGGLKYQDKKKRIFGAKVIGSNVGTIYEGELSLPFSFRRK